MQKISNTTYLNALSTFLYNNNCKEIKSNLQNFYDNFISTNNPEFFSFGITQFEFSKTFNVRFRENIIRFYYNNILYKCIFEGVTAKEDALEFYRFLRNKTQKKADCSAERVIYLKDVFLDNFDEEFYRIDGHTFNLNEICNVKFRVTTLKFIFRGALYKYKFDTNEECIKHKEALKAICNSNTEKYDKCVIINERPVIEENHEINIGIHKFVLNNINNVSYKGCSLIFDYEESRCTIKFVNRQECMDKVNFLRRFVSMPKKGEILKRRHAEQGKKYRRVVYENY